MATVKKKEDFDVAKAAVQNITNGGITGQVPNTAGDTYFSQSDAYRKQADDLYQQYVNGRGSFNYDFNQDTVFQNLKNSYNQQAQAAADNAAATAALRTGGYGNSYGTVAAGQAYNNSINQLYDVVPELEQAAYGRYQNDRNELLNQYGILSDLANNMYSRGQAERGYADDRADSLWNKRFQQQQYADSREDTMYNRDFAERQYADSRKDTEFEQGITQAQLGAQYGDYSLLNGMGIDTTQYKSVQDHQRSLDEALQLANVGDYSALEKMGYDMTNAKNAVNQAQKDSEFEKQLSIAQQYAAVTGDASLLLKLMNGMGISTTGLRTTAPVTTSSSGGESTSTKQKKNITVTPKKDPPQKEPPKKDTHSKNYETVLANADKYNSVSTLKSYLTEQRRAGNITQAEVDQIFQIINKKKKLPDREPPTAQQKYDSLNAADKWVVDQIANGYDPKWALSK